jgi:hypothetical protein
VLNDVTVTQSSSVFEVVLSRLGYVSAYAGIALPNQASVALHEALGFSHIATFPQVGYKLGQWHSSWRLLGPFSIQTSCRPTTESRTGSCGRPGPAS